MLSQTRPWTALVLALLVPTALAAGPGFTSVQHGFSLSAPDGWQKVEGVEGTVVAFVAPTKAGQFRPNVNVVVEPLPRVVPLSVYTDLSLQNISKADAFTNYKLISRRSVTVSGKPASEVTWSAKQGDNALQFRQVYIVKPDKAFVITFTDVQGNFARSSAGGQAVLNTFKYK